MGINMFSDGHCGWDMSLWVKERIPIRRNPNEIQGENYDLKPLQWVLDHEEN